MSQVLPAGSSRQLGLVGCGAKSAFALACLEVPVRSAGSASPGTCTSRRGSSRQLGLRMRLPAPQSSSQSKQPQHRLPSSPSPPSRRRYTLRETPHLKRILILRRDFFAESPAPCFRGPESSPDKRQDGPYCPQLVAANSARANESQPSATGSNWEKYQKKYADDEIEEKKITPLTDEYVAPC